MSGTGASDEICRVVVKQAFGGRYYADVGHCSTQVYPSPRQAAEAGNKLGKTIYGSTVRLVDLRQFGGR